MTAVSSKREVTLNVEFMKNICKQYISLCCVPYIYEHAVTSCTEGACGSISVLER